MTPTDAELDALVLACLQRARRDGVDPAAALRAEGLDDVAAAIEELYGAWRGPSAPISFTGR